MLSADSDALLRRAQQAEQAVDLYLAPGATRLVADRLVEILHRAPTAALTERALWNILFAAGELSLRVDVYRSHDLFRAAAALVERCGREPLAAGDGRAAALEMTFDFFFARTEHPLLPLRAREVVATLTALFEAGRVGTRAALHGLGHLVGLARAADLPALEADAVAAIEDCARAQAISGDAALSELADEARAGALR